ncbi:MAG: hypothetical protein ABIG61_13760 [Planctomycetota bacterium]
MIQKTVVAGEVVDLCQKLVRIPSVDPQDKAVLESPYGQERIDRFVFGWLV